MREIKYRGRSLSTGEWVYGGLIMWKTRAFIACHNHITDRTRWHEVDPATVGQYTGLKDKNDADIYEGDIFKARWPDVTAVVEWDAENARFLGFTLESERKIVYIGQEPAVEVIDNIHDNPELLGGAASERA